MVDPDFEWEFSMAWKQNPSFFSTKEKKTIQRGEKYICGFGYTLEI